MNFPPSNKRGFSEETVIMKGIGMEHGVGLCFGRKRFLDGDGTIHICISAAIL